mmetsp:Transcript_96612/g.258303  ORF Transcript_96612/g.258303 Transcript_96612/m.258303 type:complete len:82 (-) Transcript_96612:6-251(-)
MAHRTTGGRRWQASTCVYYAAAWTTTGTCLLRAACFRLRLWCLEPAVVKAMRAGVLTVGSTREPGGSGVRNLCANECRCWL